MNNYDMSNRYEQKLGRFTNINSKLQLELSIVVNLYDENQSIITIPNLCLKIFHKRYYLSMIDTSNIFVRYYQMINNQIEQVSINLSNKYVLTITNNKFNIYNEKQSSEFEFISATELNDFMQILNQFQTTCMFFTNNILLAKNLADINKSLSNSIHKINSIDINNITPNTIVDEINEPLNDVETIDIKETSIINDDFDKGINEIIDSGQVNYVKENIEKIVEVPNTLGDIQLSTEAHITKKKASEYEIKKSNALFGFKNIEELNNRLINMIGPNFDLELSTHPFNLIYKAEDEILYMRLQYVKEQLELNIPINKHPIILSTIVDNPFIDEPSCRMVLSFLYTMIKYSDDNKLMLIYKVLVLPYIYHIFRNDWNTLETHIKKMWDNSNFGIITSNVTYDDIKNKLNEIYTIISKLPVMDINITKHVLSSKMKNKLIDYNNELTYQQNVKELFSSKNKEVKEIKEDAVKYDINFNLPDEFKKYIKFDKYTDKGKDVITNTINEIHNYSRPVIDVFKKYKDDLNLFIYSFDETLLRYYYVAEKISKDKIDLSKIDVLDKNYINELSNMATYELISLLTSFLN